MGAKPNNTEWLADRSDSDCLKWGKYRGTDILPMWVADMDCRCAEPVLEALHERIDHGIFGYTLASKSTNEAVCHWLKTQHNWTVHPDWIVWTPGLVTALNVVCRAFAEPDEEVLTFTPIYPPFMEAPELSGRGLIKCPLKNDGGRYSIDFDRLEATLTDKARVILLCSPHNPVGRVWEKETLQKLAEICLERNILLCSDEIHCDLLLDKDVRHIPTATLGDDIANNTVTLMSPAKTFNLPGLNCGFAIIQNPELRQQYKDTADGIVPWNNALGYVACQAAFTQGLPWLKETLDYLRENHRILHEAVNAIDGLSMDPLEATYLAWIDVSKLSLKKPGRFFKKAGLALIDGAVFDQPGFVRLNFACSRENLLLAIERIKQAVTNREEKQ
ncbi:MAG: MalY/PatB family protein [Planctomycetota bacterium]|jgi:cystathionine beta-lyase